MSIMKYSTLLFTAALWITVVHMSVPCMVYEELVPRFNRITSPVTIRKITHPTRANLDYAAYDRNPVLVDKPVKLPRKKIGRSTVDMTFGGVLALPVMSISETPLSSVERDQPLAWKPMVKRIWGVVKDEHLASSGARIASFKWSDSSVFQPYQEISTVYLHDTENGSELWVKVEFAQWVTFLPHLTDDDGDGSKEIYGRLSVDSLPTDSLGKIIAWIKNDYMKTVLNEEQARDWITDLASYWYPTRNTDIIDLAADGIWPDNRTGKKVRKKIGTMTVKDPLAVIEGKPITPDKPIYNVFIVTGYAHDSVSAPEQPHTPSKIPLVSQSTAGDWSKNYLENMATFTNELNQYGAYYQWNISNQPFFDALRSWLTVFPKEQMGLPGKDGWLFFRKSVEYILGGDLELQCDTMNPLPHIVMFNNYLQYRGIDLLFVIVPNKEEVYFDKLGVEQPAPTVPIVNPYGRKILSSLQQAGVEVIDLLPLFLKEKSCDTAGGELIYQKQDTHWSSRGLQLAAQKIADRIKTYSWYQSCRDTITYTYVDTVIQRQGDLVERLPNADQTAFSNVAMPARKVIFPDGTDYRGNQPDSPILLIGDSFTGVFELIDCKSAGVGAHIAARSRIPVDIITSWGGGPMVRQKMLRVRGDRLDRKRVVIYMMVARDLFNYITGWEPLHG